MKFVRGTSLLLLMSALTVCAADSDLGRPYTVYNGASDASAAVPLSNDFFIVADDETNILRIYKAGAESLPIGVCDLTEFLVEDSKFPEADIEGAALVNDRIYWITSHGRNKDGKMRPNRYRFFATSVKMENGSVVINPIGKPCRTLIEEMIKSPATQNLNLEGVTRLDDSKLKKKDREKLAPKEKGLNIEGLCASPDGSTSYIGFRNPQIADAAGRKMAFVVPLYNAGGIVENGSAAKFGSPILLDLGGLGIRSMEYSRFHKTYFIVAGPKSGGPGLALYRWSGEGKEPPVLVRRFTKGDDFTPEALVIFEDSGRLLLLSDDGDLVINISSPEECMPGELLENGKCLNKHLRDQNKKTFRAFQLDL